MSKSTTQRRTTDERGHTSCNGKPYEVIRMNEVLQRIGLSRSTVWRLERAGKFPKRHRLGPNSIGWVSSEIDEWIATRARVS